MRLRLCSTRATRPDKPCLVPSFGCSLPFRGVDRLTLLGISASVDVRVPVGEGNDVTTGVDVHTAGSTTTGTVAGGSFLGGLSVGSAAGLATVGAGALRVDVGVCVTGPTTTGRVAVGLITAGAAVLVDARSTMGVAVGLTSVGVAVPAGGNSGANVAMGVGWRMGGAGSRIRGVAGVLRCATGV